VGAARGERGMVVMRGTPCETRRGAAQVASGRVWLRTGMLRSRPNAAGTDVGSAVGSLRSLCRGPRHRYRPMQSDPGCVPVCPAARTPRSRALCKSSGMVSAPRALGLQLSRRIAPFSPGLFPRFASAASRALLHPSRPARASSPSHRARTSTWRSSGARSSQT
jgi:hypothetical protein